MSHKWIIVVAVLSSVALLSTITLVIILIRRRRLQEKTKENPNTGFKSMASKKAFSLQAEFHNANMEGQFSLAQPTL